MVTMSTATSLPSDVRIFDPQPVRQYIPPALVKANTLKARQAIGLMRFARKPLDFWQQQSVAIMCGVDDVGLWACPDYFEWVARQNGKGAILEARALAGLFCYGEPFIGWSAHEYRTAMEARLRMMTLIRNMGAQDIKSPDIIHVQLPGTDKIIRVKFDNSHGEEAIVRLDTGQRLKFFARSKGAGRGFSAPVWLLDEVFALTDEQLDAIGPTQLTFENAQTIYTSTPPLTGDTGGPMFNLRARADAGDPELGGRDWGLRKPDGSPMWLDEIDGTPGPDGVPPLNVDDLDLWRKTNPGGSPGATGRPRITERARRKDRRSRGRLGYAREALCIWPRPVAAAGAAIDPDVWTNTGDIESRPASAGLVLAIDVSPGARSASIAVAGRRADGRFHVKVMDYRAGTGWLAERLTQLAGMLDEYAVERLALYVRRHLIVSRGGNPREVDELIDALPPPGRLKATMINAAGPAGAVYDELTAAGFRLTKVDGGEWARACAAFLADVEQDRMRHCAQDGLNDAVTCATRKFVGDGAWYWSRKDSTGDISPLCAATAAAHGFRIHGEAAEQIIAVGFGSNPDERAQGDRPGDGWGTDEARERTRRGPEPVIVPRGPAGAILPRRPR